MARFAKFGKLVHYNMQDSYIYMSKNVELKLCIRDSHEHVYEFFKSIDDSRLNLVRR